MAMGMWVGWRERRGAKGHKVGEDDGRRLERKRGAVAAAGKWYEISVHGGAKGDVQRRRGVVRKGGRHAERCNMG